MLFKRNVRNVPGLSILGILVMASACLEHSPLDFAVVAWIFEEASYMRLSARPAAEDRIMSVG